MIIITFMPSYAIYEIFIMNHNFNIEVARLYSIEEAIILENMFFWIQKNKANDKHFYDGDYWTYNSAEAFTELFPYWSAHQIRRILKRMEDNNLIKKGNYNKLTYDRTSWYAITQHAFSVLTNSISQIHKMEVTESQNGISETAKPIPDINTSINSDVKTDNKHIVRFEEFWDLYLHKVNKAKAKQIWINKKLDNMADEIIEKLKHQNDIAYSRHLANKEKGYIPHPTTYLNGERWDDDLAEVKLKRASQDLSGQDYENDRGFD